MEKIIQLALKHFPRTQAIYLYGTYGTSDERLDSDVDIGLLLPLVESKEVGLLHFSELKTELEDYLVKDVDLINLGSVNTVLQKEIIMAERRIYCGD